MELSDLQKVKQDEEKTKLNSPVFLFFQAVVASPLCNQQVKLSASDEPHRGPNQGTEKTDKNELGNIRPRCCSQIPVIRIWTTTPAWAEGKVYHPFPISLSKRQGVPFCFRDTCVSRFNEFFGFEKDGEGTIHF